MTVDDLPWMSHLFGLTRADIYDLSANEIDAYRRVAEQMVKGGR